MSFCRRLVALGGAKPYQWQARAGKRLGAQLRQFRWIFHIHRCSWSAYLYL